jgi:fatty-acyl-CoA synthase
MQYGDNAVEMERVDSILHHARVAPDAIALVDLETGRKFTYAKMNERVNRIAGFLRRHFNVAKGDRVAVLSHNSSDIFEIQFACWRIGAIFVPINWRLTVSEIEFILSDATPRVLVGDTEFSESLAALVGKLDFFDLVTRGGKESGYERLLKRCQGTPAEAHVALDDTASLIYTSGTTGRPKGARITHRMELFTCLNYVSATAITRNAKTLVVLPLFHVGGLNCFPNPIFNLGGTVMVMKTFDPKRFLDILKDPAQGVTHVFAVPTIFSMMSQQPGFDSAKFDHVMCAAVGGAAVPISLLQVLENQGLPIQQGWGMTESASMGSMLQPDKTREKLGSAGLPVQYVNMRIADENGRVLPPNAIGELQVKGPSITKGYWNRPEANEKSYIDGWFRTGDAAYLDDEGYLYIVDRWTDMYISGGENVYPAEVENVLAGIEGVLEAAVIGIANERWGQVGRAFIVLKAGAALSPEQVRAVCADRLAKYKIPHEIIFTESIPHNAAGKILKAELPRGAIDAAG